MFPKNINCKISLYLTVLHMHASSLCSNHTCKIRGFLEKNVASILSDVFQMFLSRFIGNNTYNQTKKTFKSELEALTKKTCILTTKTYFEFKKKKITEKNAHQVEKLLWCAKGLNKKLCTNTKEKEE